MNINIVKKMKNIGLVVLAALLLFSCHKEQAVAPMLTYDGKANYTIRELLDSGGLDSLDNKVICGTVVSSDEHGNFYKVLMIQDDEAGIQIKMSSKNLYNRYFVGQKVFVELKDLVLGSNSGTPVLGLGDVNNLAALPSSAELKCIFRDGAAGNEPAPYIIDKNSVTVADLDAHLNMLIEIPNCEFASSDVGGTFVDKASSNYTKATLNFKVEGKQIIVNTSNYADATIATATIPSGTGTLRGVLTLYKTTYQIVLRSIADVQWDNVGPAPQTSAVYDITEHLSETMFGWSTVNNNGDWTQLSSQGNYGFTLSGNANTDSWVVSPALSLSGYDNLLLKFGRYNNIECYYTTTSYSAGSPIVASNWTKIDLPEGAMNREEHSVTLPNTVKAIAFRNAGAVGYSAVYNMKIVAVN